MDSATCSADGYGCRGRSGSPFASADQDILQCENERVRSAAGRVRQAELWDGRGTRPRGCAADTTELRRS